MVPMKWLCQIACVILQHRYAEVRGGTPEPMRTNLARERSIHTLDDVGVRVGPVHLIRLDNVDGVSGNGLLGSALVGEALP